MFCQSWMNNSHLSPFGSEGRERINDQREFHAASDCCLCVHWRNPHQQSSADQCLLTQSACLFYISKECASGETASRNV